MLILAIEPFLPGTKRVLEYIVGYLVEKKRVRFAIDIFPQLRRLKELEYRHHFFDVFSQTINWQNEYFKIANADYGLGDYALANTKAIYNHMSSKAVTLLTLREIFRDSNGDKYKCIGFPADTFAAAEHFCNVTLPGSPARIPAKFVNFVFYAGVVFTSLGWILLHTRFKRIKTKYFFFAADFIGDERDLRLYQEVKDGGDLLMVSRGLEHEKKSHINKRSTGYTFCKRSDGLLGLKDVIPTLKMIITDEWRVWRQFNILYPTLFRRMATLPYRRLLYRGLFIRYKTRVFWGRDPYSEDHIIRRQELHRIDGVSWGVNTSTVNCTIMVPRYLHVSFDRYYVFGLGKYMKYYGDTWAKDMELVPAGSFTAERKHYAKRFDYRPSDIAVFTAAYIGEPELVTLVRGLAKAFPDRKILLQVRDSYHHLSWAEDFISECQKGLENLELASGNVYDIFVQARYGISDPSSVVAEALQFGMTTFAFDLPHLQKENIDREFPGLTVNSADDAISRIRAIEKGEWRYPIEKFQDIVDMSGKVFFDRIRVDLGMRPKEHNPVPLIEEYKEKVSS